jgi:Aromatic-ring-opening dioxygenase LigAB, LigA subunit
MQGRCGNRRPIVEKCRNRNVEPVMSIYAVNYLCRELLRDHAFRTAMKADPAAALAALDLTADERAALIAGDVGKLFRMGANGFLMGYLARFEVCGLNVQSYNERMRAVKVDEIGQPVA